MYYIINKIEFINGVVVYTPVAYTTDLTLCSEINTAYDNTLGDWNNTNLAALEDGSVLISEFFETTPLVHIARTTSTEVGSLLEITTIEEL